MSKELPKSEAEKIEELQGIVRRALSGDPDKVDETYEGIVLFVEELKKEHPDLHEYVLFHVLGAGTPPDYAKKLDLPDGEMEEFIRGLEK